MSVPLVNHASSTLGSLTLNDAPTLAKHAVTVEYVASQISDLVGGAPGALDTLGEIAAAMAVSDGNVAGAITASIAANADNISLALASNVANAASSSANASSIEANSAEIAANASSLSANTSSIETNASSIEANALEIAANASSSSANAASIEANALEIAANLASSSANATSIETSNANLVAEQNRAEQEEYRIEGLVTANGVSVQNAFNQLGEHSASHDSHVESLSFLDLNKFDKVGGTVTGDMFVTGNVNVDSAAYLYIGTKWRIEAYGAELHFRYSSDGLNWGSGIPFVSV